MPAELGGSLRLVSGARAAVRDGDVVYSSIAPVGERETIGAMMVRNRARFGQRPAFYERSGGRFHPTAWRQLVADAGAFAAFLIERGVAGGDRVAVVSPNRGEMLVTELATMSLGAIYVPIFAGYSPEQTSALLLNAEPTVVILQQERWLEPVALPPSARLVLAFDAPTGRQIRRVADVVTEYGTPAHRARRSEVLERAVSLDPDTPCLMMYTSGTSGRLKGVVLTHDNILSQRRALAGLWSLTPGDRFLSYLPWHHSFGGIFEKYTALYTGAPIFIDDSLGKDFDALLRNWLSVRPTVYFSVPKVYQQLVARAQGDPEEESRIFHSGLRFVFTAAAPLPANLSEFFAARHIPVIEGWGLTETSPCCTLTDPAEPRSVPGKVGYPIPGVAVRIAEDGEILIRGPNVMVGYFRDGDATAQVLPGDGWFHTGDLGELVGAGLKFVSRKDRVFKMLNAEKVVPTEIENRLAGMNQYIRHVIVTGDGRSYLTALVFPDFFRIAEEFGGDTAEADRVVKESLRTTILEFNRTHPVKYERIQALVVVTKELTIEDHELTPSLKVRVRNVLSQSEPYLEAVYEPHAGCDCRFLRRVLRLAGDNRPCFGGLDRTLDRCHECGSFIYDDPSSEAALKGRG